MAENSQIGWTDHTQNFWQGCDKVSQECKHYYIAGVMGRAGRTPFGGPMRTKDWSKPYKWQRRAAEENRRFRVFTCLLSDFFHEGADEWRSDAWEIIRQCDRLDWLVLTKRPERIADRLPVDWGEGYGNVWLGVICGISSSLPRVEILRRTPARVRFVSAEPLLGRPTSRPTSTGRSTGSSPAASGRGSGSGGKWTWTGSAGSTGSAARRESPTTSSRSTREAGSRKRASWTGSGGRRGRHWIGFLTFSRAEKREGENPRRGSEGRRNTTTHRNAGRDRPPRRGGELTGMPTDSYSSPGSCGMSVGVLMAGSIGPRRDRRCSTGCRRASRLGGTGAGPRQGRWPDRFATRRKRSAPRHPGGRTRQIERGPRLAGTGQTGADGTRGIGWSHAEVGLGFPPPEAAPSSAGRSIS